MRSNQSEDLFLREHYGFATKIEKIRDRFQVKIFFIFRENDFKQFLAGLFPQA